MLWKFSVAALDVAITSFCFGVGIWFAGRVLPIGDVQPWNSIVDSVYWAAFGYINGRFFYWRRAPSNGERNMRG